MISCISGVVNFYFYFSFSLLYFGGVFNNTIITLMLVGYKLIIANLVLHASLAIHLLKSNAHLLNVQILCKASPYPYEFPRTLLRWVRIFPGSTQ